MGRNNGDFQAQALFHGSDYPFNVGDIVVPGTRGRAYATPDRSNAEYYAGKAGQVFTVEPLFEDESYQEHHDPTSDGEKGPLNFVSSLKGFRVIGKEK